MNRQLTCILLVIAALLVGCNEKRGDYIAAASISKSGFAKNNTGKFKAHGQEIKVWGFVDHGNMFGNDHAKKILEDWWGGDGPNATTWRFNLKAREDDGTGQSFAVHIPNDEGRDKLLRTFVMNAKSGRPTKVFVKGRIFTFDAPLNISFSIPAGLYMEVQSSQDILLDLPQER